MYRRFVLSATVVAASLIGTQAVYAAPITSNDAPVHAFIAAQGKLVKFNVRNDSKSPMRLKAGESEIAIEPGKTANLKLTEGTQLVVVEASNREPGAVVATISSDFSGSTLALR